MNKKKENKFFVVRLEPGTHEIKIPWDKSIGPFIENSVQTNLFRKIGGAKKLVDILTGRRCFDFRASPDGENWKVRTKTPEQSAVCFDFLP